MRLLAPLVPAWLAGLWLLIAAEGLWSDDLPHAAPGDGVAGGWVLVGTLVLCTAGYVAAPLLGRNLAVGTVSSSIAGLGSANGAQEAFGTGVVRIAALLALYLLVGGLVAVELA